MGEIGWVKKGALKTTADLLACLLQGPQRVRKVLLGSDVPFRTGYGARVLPYNSQGGDAIATGMSWLAGLDIKTLVDLHLVSLCLVVADPFSLPSSRLPQDPFFAAWVKDGKVEPPNFKLSMTGSKIPALYRACVLAGSPDSRIARNFLPTNQNQHDRKLKTIQQIMG